MTYTSSILETKLTDDGFPREPTFINDTGLDAEFLAELALKAIYYSTRPAVGELADMLGLSLPVMQELLGILTRDGLVEIVAGEGQGPATYRYRLTGKGQERAGGAFERNAYVGPAPVPLADYIAQVRRQSIGGAGFTPAVVASALNQLVLNETTLTRVGRAIYSGRPTLIHGASGNGKSTIAHLLGQAISGDVVIPYALEVYGHIARLFDPSKHRLIDGKNQPRGSRHDRRWARTQRPAILTGGELTRQGLEFVLDDRSKVYEAPLQLKANGGILIIDDFGRQQIPAVELLNRWIVALEGGVDHLSLHTGQTIEVPFDVITFFSTNLPPDALADEAFLRRIRYKIEIPDPTPEEFGAIFQRVCKEQGVAFNKPAVDYLLERWYRPYDRHLRGCHPRDLVEAIVDGARYAEKETPALTNEALDEVCQTYFLTS